MNVLPAANPVSAKGLYFTKGQPFFTNNKKFIANESVLLSKTGVQYIEDTKVSEEIKERFAKDKYIKSLAEKFDVFIAFVETKVEKYRNEYFSEADIFWTDSRKSNVQMRKLGAFSEFNNKTSTEKMFERLNRQKFLSESKIC